MSSEGAVATELPLRVARPMPRVVLKSAVDATVSLLRDEILDRDDGEWLGSEDDLLARLGVSRPTLRQAARLLEAEEVLVVRRGPNGGLFARRPSTDAVSRMATVYLRSRGAKMVDVARSWFLLLEESARRAAEEITPEDRGTVVADVERLWADVDGDDVRAQLAATHLFSVYLADLSDSQTLGLFVRVLSTLLDETPPEVLAMDWDDTIEGPARTNLARVARAIEDGDADGAARNIREHGERMVARLSALMPDRLV